MENNRNDRSPFPLSFLHRPARNENQEALVMFLMAAMVTGIILVLVAIQGYKLFRRHVLKIPDKPKSFILDKKVKCTSG